MYYLFGDYYLAYYKNYGFIVIKLLQSFMRGSADNIDVDPNGDRYSIDDRTGSFDSQAKYSYGPFYSIVNKAGFTGYLLVKYYNYNFSFP
jgi:hypothetical protein